MVNYICPRCCYKTDRKGNIERHLNSNKVCKVTNLDVDINDYVDIILQDQCTNKIIKILHEDKDIELRKENDKFKEENDKFKEENDKFKEENDKFKEENAKLKEENAKLKEENAKDSGYIYVLHNKTYNYHGENIYKIGCSKKPSVRLLDYSTSYVEQSTLEYISTRFDNKLKAEKHLFGLLKNYRLKSNREFFQLPLDEIIKTIKTIE